MQYSCDCPISFPPPQPHFPWETVSPSRAHAAKEAFSRCAVWKRAVNFGSRQRGCERAAWCLSSILLAQHPQENYSEKYSWGVGNHCKMPPPPPFLTTALVHDWWGVVRRRREQGGEFAPKIGVYFPSQSLGKCCCLSLQLPHRAARSAMTGSCQVHGSVALLMGKERNTLLAPWCSSNAGRSLHQPPPQPFGEGWPDPSVQLGFAISHCTVHFSGPCAAPG